MKTSASFLSMFEPILDTYMDAAAGLTGCRSMGRERESCEFDLLLVRQEHTPSSTIRIGESYVDLMFSTEKELANPGTPEVSLSLAFVKPIRDKELVLSTSISEARESLARNYQRAAEERLASSLKAIGRAEQALSKGVAVDADFWVVSAAYDFAFAWLEASKTVPSPSHLLTQVRQVSRGQPGMFEAFSSAAGLGGASRESCQQRLDALSLVFDLVGTLGEEGKSRESFKASFELLRLKSTTALGTSQPADSYCFVGQEVAELLPRVLSSRVEKKDPISVVSSLSGGEHPLLASSVIRGLGLRRRPEDLERALAALKGQVSSLTRKT